MFSIQAFVAPELGNASYVLADLDTGLASVVDPVRDIDQYLAYAEANGLTVTRSLETHVHSDFISGSRELASSVGASIEGLDTETDYPMGTLTVRPLHTPGHTPDHKSYLLSEGGRPSALFTGGAVMVGAVARTDLLGPHLATHLALEAFRTLHERLRGLPDDLAVFPTHGSGSFCGTGAGTGHETTLGRERETNPFFQATEVMQFLARILDQHRYPAYFSEMGVLNRNGAQLLGRKPQPPAKVTADDLARLMGAGAAVIDVRRGVDYDHGHIPGSYSVGLEGGSFSAWVGWLLPLSRAIVLAGGSDGQHAEAQRQLHRIGFDNIVGALEGSMDAWVAAGRTLSTFETASIEDMARWIENGDQITVIDARDDHEWFAGHVPGAIHMYVPDVPQNHAQIPREAPVAVHCGAGYRAGIAASLLEQAGLTGITHVIGAYSDWDRLNLPKTTPVRASG